MRDLLCCLLFRDYAPEEKVYSCYTVVDIDRVGWINASDLT